MEKILNTLERIRVARIEYAKKSYINGKTEKKELPTFYFEKVL